MKKISITLILIIILGLFLTGCNTDNTSTDSEMLNVISQPSNVEKTNPKNCLSDEDCFQEALKTCDSVIWNYCMFGTCENAAIIGEKDNACSVRTWMSDSSGKIINCDKTCSVDKNKDLVSRPYYLCCS